MKKPQGSAILAVDDDVVSRRVLESSLKRAGYEVIVEGSAEAAQATFDRIGAERFSCIVTDYRMPGLNGVDLRAWIWLRDPTISAILVTAEGEQKLVEQSLRAGFADFLNKPLSADDLRRAVASGVAETHHRRELARLEMHVGEVARAQRHLLTSELRNGLLNVELFARPKYEAGGDFFSQIQISDQQEVVVMADVSGHDLSAAYTSAYFQGMVRGMLESGSPLVDVFSRCNQFLAEEWTPEANGTSVSISACSLRYDRETDQVGLLSCGGPLPVFTDREGHSDIPCGARAFPLGWFADNPISKTRFPRREGEITMWTDGVEELAERLNASPLSLSHALLDSRSSGRKIAFIEQASDDVMTARIRIRPESSSHEQFHAVFSEHYRPEDAGDIDRWQKYWSNSIKLAVPDAPEDTAFDALLCAREALLNALNHGCSAGESASLEAAYCPALSLLRVCVSDPGCGHDFDIGIHEFSDAGEMIDQHRGLMLILGLSHNVTTRRQGAELLMDFRFDPKGLLR